MFHAQASDLFLKMLRQIRATGIVPKREREGRIFAKGLRVLSNTLPEGRETGSCLRAAEEPWSTAAKTHAGSSCDVTVEIMSIPHSSSTRRVVRQTYANQTVLAVADGCTAAPAAQSVETRKGV